MSGAAADGRVRHRDLVIRGRVFATASEAARALGVQPQTVMKAARAGMLDRVGTGRVGRLPGPVRVRGRVFASASEAARALGVSASTVRAAVERGTEDRVGLGPVGGTCTRATRPVRLGGLRFRSMAEADRALGFPPGTLSWVMRRGGVRSRERVLGVAMALLEKGEE